MENFDLMAKDFDTDPRIKRSIAIADEIRLHITDGHNKSALEYGCGTGLVGFQLINDFDTILFADSSKGMIEQVRQKLIALNKPENAAMCCDFLTEIPQDLKVDYIFSSLVLHHIKDTKAILSRFFELLNDSGHLLIVDLDADDGSFHAKHPDFDEHNGFKQAALIELAENVRFSNTYVKSFYFGKKVANEKEIFYSFFILDAEK